MTSPTGFEPVILVVGTSAVTYRHGLKFADARSDIGRIREESPQNKDRFIHHPHRHLRRQDSSLEKAVLF